jgi:hypothetical protein
MLPAMQSILTEPAASTLLVLDAMDGATLTEIARTTGRPLSTIQRAVNGLVDANVVVRETPRGRLRFTPEAPRHALRELAEWRLGKKDADRIARAARVAYAMRGLHLGLAAQHDPRMVCDLAITESCLATTAQARSQTAGVLSRAAGRRSWGVEENSLLRLRRTPNRPDSG